MTPLNLVITNAGIAAYARAQLGEDIDLSIAKVGFTAQAFSVAPTLTALPGEFRRVATVSGNTVGLDVVHMVVRDAEAVSYTVRGFGLFLADGTLFAVYGQADVLVEKSTRSATLIALDLRFPREIAAAITFGDTNFLNPPSTESTAGVLRIATDAEADAATSADTAITPKALARRLIAVLNAYIPATERGAASGVAALNSAGKVPASQLPNQAVTSVNTKTGDVILTAADVGAPPVTRKVTTAGLAKGGGTMESDREIHVDAATAAQTLAGAATDVVLTPASIGALADDFAAFGEWAEPGGVVKKIGIVSGSYGEGSVAVQFRTPFPNACKGVFLTAINVSGGTLRDIFMHRQSMSKDGFVAFVEKAGSDGSTIDGFDWLAIGN